MMHSGHYNAIRQAHALGDILVVGVVDDDSVRKNKGPPVLRDYERAEILKSCRWADEINI